MTETWVIEGRLEMPTKGGKGRFGIMKFCKWTYIGFGEKTSYGDDGAAFPTEDTKDAFQGDLDTVIKRFTTSNWNPRWIFKLTCLETKESIPTEIFV